MSRTSICDIFFAGTKRFAYGWQRFTTSDDSREHFRAPSVRVRTFSHVFMFSHPPTQHQLFFYPNLAFQGKQFCLKHFRQRTKRAFTSLKFINSRGECSQTFLRPPRFTFWAFPSFRFDFIFLTLKLNLPSKGIKKNFCFSFLSALTLRLA